MASHREPTSARSVEPDDDVATLAPPSGNGFLVDAEPRRSEHHAPSRPLSYGSPASAPEDPPPTDPVSVAKVVGWGLIVLAVLIFLGTRSLPFPLFLLAGGIFVLYYVASPERLRREQVIDRWDLLVDGGRGHGEQVVRTTIVQIDQQRLPQVTYKQADLAPGILRGLTGTTRPFLVVSQVGNRRLQPYRIYVNVRNYGGSLQTSWFLAYQRSFFERLKPNPLVQLDLFDEQDLRAYVAAVHHCFIDSVVDLLTTLGQDTSRLDRSSKGFLGIS